MAKNLQTHKIDFLIIGAGVIGSAIAMGLTKLGVKDVLVVDLDLAGEWSSSELNAGGVRATWSQKINLLTSKYSIKYFQSVADEVGYRACGYLWMHRPETFEGALRAREMHLSHGWAVDVLDVPALRKKCPFIDKTDDLAGALFGVNDGLVNPNRLKEHYREEALKGGARFLDSTWVQAHDYQKNLHQVRAFQFKEGLTSVAKKNLLIQNPKNIEHFESSQGEWITIESKNIVNAGGAWAPELAKILGYSCPSRPVRRQISLFHARDLDLSDQGMIIDPSGVYFHPESIYGLSGFATRNESPGFNFDYDAERFFDEQIWAPLSERSTKFESLKHVSGWAGLYEESPDHHAIVGRAHQSRDIFEAHSFSGHGVMHSYAVGVELAELMVNGAFKMIDLAELSADRFATGRTIESETWVI